MLINIYILIDCKVNIRQICFFYFLENFLYLNERITVLTSKCINELKNQGFLDNQIHIEPFLHLRYDGTDCALMCSASYDNLVEFSTAHGDFLSGFLARYSHFFIIIICFFTYFTISALLKL